MDCRREERVGVPICPKCGIDVAEGGRLVTTKRIRIFGREPFGKEIVRLGTVGDETVDEMRCRSCGVTLHGPCVETLRVGIA